MPLLFTPKNFSVNSNLLLFTQILITNSDFKSDKKLLFTYRRKKFLIYHIVCL